MHRTNECLLPLHHLLLVVALLGRHLPSPSCIPTSIWGGLNSQRQITEPDNRLGTTLRCFQKELATCAAEMGCALAVVAGSPAACCGRRLPSTSALIHCSHQTKRRLRRRIRHSNHRIKSRSEGDGEEDANEERGKGVSLEEGARGTWICHPGA